MSICPLQELFLLKKALVPVANTLINDGMVLMALRRSFNKEICISQEIVPHSFCKIAAIRLKE